MQKYDVVIVGAGPAGLNCARVLANSNLSVLLLEKNTVIGPKICAGGLTTKTYIYLTALGLPDELIGKKFYTVAMRTPLNRTLIHGTDCIVATIARHDLGQWQLIQLKDSNIEIRTAARVSAVNIQAHTLTINNTTEIAYRYLVGADGAISIIRKSLGLTSKASGVGMQYLLPDTNSFKQLELFYNDKLFHAHYSWIFPHKDYISIGCGGNLSSLSYKDLTNNFHIWLRQQKIDVTNLKLYSFPFNFTYQGYQFANVFLAGEAAGLASAFSGEGIYQALISGEEIAKQILDSNYISPKLPQLIHRKLNHDKLTNYLTKSRLLRKIEFELIALLLKNKKLSQYLLTKI